MKKYWWFWGICILIILIYHQTFGLYFFQDDFFSLNTSRVESFGEWIRLWLPNQNVVYYRPLGIPLFFWLGQKVFGTNFLGYRLAAFLAFLATVFLVYKLAFILTGKDKVAKLTAFFYGVAPLHFLSLAWIVNFSYILGAFFYFLTIFLYIKSLKEPGLFKIAVLTFGLGILTNEIVLTVPIMVLAIDCYFRKKLNLRNFLIFLSISFPYFILRLLVTPTGGGVYELGLSIKSGVATLRWYIFWAFGLPESTSGQFASLLKINPIFVLSSFWTWFKAMCSLAFYIFFLMACLPLLMLFFQKRLRKIWGFGVFCGFWFLVNILPFLLLPQHAYPHYGAVASFGVYLFLSFLIFKGFEKAKDFVFLRRFVLGVAVCSWIGLAFLVMRFNLLSHWAPRQAVLAKRILKEIEKFYPKESAGAEVEIYVVENNNEKKLALSEKNAIQFFYQNKGIGVFYITSDMAVQQFGGNYAHCVEEWKQKGIYLVL